MGKKSKDASTNPNPRRMAARPTSSSGGERFEELLEEFKARKLPHLPNHLFQLYHRGKRRNFPI
jgi:hypothetical protein